MTDVFLISEAKLREFTDMDNNVDTALIKNAIREAQDIPLQACIGTLLYNKILNLVETGDITQSQNSDYKYILDAYIQDFLLYAAYYYALDSIFLRARNNGLLVPNGGENSIAADRSLYNVKKQTVENKMNYYNDRLTNYIIEEEVKFPELNNSNKLYEQWPDYNTKYRNPFGFSKSTFYEELKRRGIKTYDSRYPQFPQ
jgi:hypothetical protein